MAHANKRITVTLIIVAFLFILAIILLIIPYNRPSYPHDSPKHEEQKYGPKSDITTTLKSTSVSTSISTTTKRIEITASQNISSTISGPDEQYSTTLTDSTDSDSKTTSHEVSYYTGKNNTYDVTETTDMTRETELKNIEISNETSSTLDYNKSTSEYSTPVNKNETLSTINSTDIIKFETTDASSIYSSEYGLSDSHATMNGTTTLETFEVIENSTTTIDVDVTSVSTEKTTSTSDSTSVSRTTSVDSTSESTNKKKAITEVFNVTICDSAENKQLAAKMLDLMNHSADPCQDFYQYTCGNGVDNPYLSQVNPRDTAMNRIKEALLLSTSENPAHVLYDSCLDKTKPNDTERIAYLNDLVLELGEYDPRPELPVNSTENYNYIDEKPFDFTDILVKMMKHHFTPLFDLTLGVDDRNPSEFILRLTPPLFQSPLTENIRQYTCLNKYYQNMNKNSTKELDKLYEDYTTCTFEGDGLEIYSKSILTSAIEINIFKNVTEEFQDKIKQSLSFNVAATYVEHILEQFPKPGDVRRSLINREFKLYTLHEMDHGGDENHALESKFFSWHNLVEKLLERSFDPETTYVQVYFPDEIFNVLDLQNWYFQEEYGSSKLRNTLLALWSHYLYSNLIDPLGHSLHTEEYCLNLVTKLLPDVTTQLYLSSFDQERLKTQIEEVKEFENLVKKIFINQYTDRSSRSIELIKDKLNLMKLDAGGELLENQYFIDNFPKIKEELNKEDFPKNAFQLLNRNRKISYSFYDQVPSHSNIMWLQSNLPYDTSSFTSYPLNTVLIPIGSVESPFYEQKGPDFINFAGLGQMVSHEIMHAFDTTGVRFEIQGAENMVDISKQCQKEQLNEIQTFNVNGVSMTANLPVELIINEALSDSSAVRMAWEAYLSTKKDEIENLNLDVLPWMDPNPIKQFYIRSAQIHCEKSSRINLLHLKENERLHGSLRVNHMARNDPLFQKAFSCPNNSPMKRDPQCSYMPLSDSEDTFNMNLYFN